MEYIIILRWLIVLYMADTHRKEAVCGVCVYAMAEAALKCRLSRHNAPCTVSEPIRQWVIYDLGNWVQ